MECPRCGGTTTSDGVWQYCIDCGWEDESEEEPLACGHDKENHGPVGELAPGRKFNWNIFGECDEENEES